MKAFKLTLGLGMISLSVCAQDPARALKVPPGFHSEMVAGEEMFANPVSFCFDDQQRVYIAEAHRKNSGVWGVTFSRWWSMEDYVGESLETRMAMYERWNHQVSFDSLTQQSEIVRLLEDTDGDGFLDRSSVFADGLNHPLAGNAAGVLALDGSVYLTCIPDLWRFQDQDADGVADVREVLQTGFGVRVGVHGHDLHGLVLGPDGRIYFTVGDRGYHFITREGREWSAPRRGAVFRCELDGSHLEVYHEGLRNPQELAFNPQGDLFTVDNNMSGGDECRILHLRQYEDSGWDATYQLSQHFLDETQRHDHPRPPWFSEGLWRTSNPDQPLWVNPALGYLTRGPSGLTHDIGWGLPEEYRDHFFVADFVGNAANSGILAFQVKPQGASYRFDHSKEFIWNVLATDVDFGYDGAVYVSDWIAGWDGLGKGRLFRVSPEEPVSATKGEDVQAILKKGLSEACEDDLFRWLNHPDHRLRIRVQMELARRGDVGRKRFLEGVSQGGSSRVRIHSIWGLELSHRWFRPLESSEIQSIMRALDLDPDWEVRAQAAKVLGDIGDRAAVEALRRGLQMNSARVVYFSILSLGKLNAKETFSEVIVSVGQWNDKDVAIRHAASWALTKMASPNTLQDLSKDPRLAVRTVGLLALRRLNDTAMISFLEDESRILRWEAIRALHDTEPSEAVLEALGSLIVTDAGEFPSWPFPIIHRVMNANYRLGTSTSAERLARLAADPRQSSDVRYEALRCLEDWDIETRFDRVTWHVTPQAAPKPWNAQIGQAIQDQVWNVFENQRTHPAAWKSPTGRTLQDVAAALMANRDLVDGDRLESLAFDATVSPSVRLSFLRQLDQRGRVNASLWRELLTLETESLLSLEAAVVLGKQGDPQGRVWFENQVSKATQGDWIQSILGRLSDPTLPFSESILLQGWSKMNRGNLSREMALDLYDASLSHEAKSLKDAVANFSISLESKELKQFDMTISGGNVEKGRGLFLNHPAQCIRCHRVDGLGGQAGPDLSKIGGQLSGVDLVWALVDPNRRIAPGYGSILLKLNSGEEVSGLLMEDQETSLSLRDSDGRIRKVFNREIQSRSDVQSGMPAMGEALTLKEMRDLVAYLKSLR